MSTDRRENSLYKSKYRELLKAIEDIKQKIENLAKSEDSMLIGSWGQGLKDALEIIDKHTKGESE